MSNTLTITADNKLMVSPDNLLVIGCGSGTRCSPSALCATISSGSCTYTEHYHAVPFYGDPVDVDVSVTISWGTSPFICNEMGGFKEFISAYVAVDDVADRVWGPSAFVTWLGVTQPTLPASGCVWSGNGMWDPLSGDTGLWGVTKIYVTYTYTWTNPYSGTPETITRCWPAWVTVVRDQATGDCTLLLITHAVLCGSNVLLKVETKSGGTSPLGTYSDGSVVHLCDSSCPTITCGGSTFPPPGPQPDPEPPSGAIYLWKSRGDCGGWSWPPEWWFVGEPDPEPTLDEWMQAPEGSADYPCTQYYYSRSIREPQIGPTAEIPVECCEEQPAPCSCPEGLATAYSLHIPAFNDGMGTSWAAQTIALDVWDSGTCSWTTLSQTFTGYSGGDPFMVSPYLSLDTTEPCRWVVDCDFTSWAKSTGDTPVGTLTGTLGEVEVN